MIALREMLRRGGELLRDVSEAPELEALVLLEESTSLSRTHLFAHPESSLTEERAAEFFTLIERRRRERLPLAYLTGRREFFSLQFSVTRDVFIPRPETELLVEEGLDYLSSLSSGPGYWHRIRGDHRRAEKALHRPRPVLCDRHRQGEPQCGQEERHRQRRCGHSLPSGPLLRCFRPRTTLRPDPLQSALHRPRRRVPPPSGGSYRTGSGALLCREGTLPHQKDSSPGSGLPQARRKASHGDRRGPTLGLGRGVWDRTHLYPGSLGKDPLHPYGPSVILPPFLTEPQGVWYFIL